MFITLSSVSGRPHTFPGYWLRSLPNRKAVDMADLRSSYGHISWKVGVSDTSTHQGHWGTTSLWVAKVEFIEARLLLGSEVPTPENELAPECPSSGTYVILSGRTMAEATFPAWFRKLLVLDSRFLSSSALTVAPPNISLSPCPHSLDVLPLPTWPSCLRSGL